jgi:hypothetical protein
VASARGRRIALAPYSRILSSGLRELVWVMRGPEGVGRKGRWTNAPRRGVERIRRGSAESAESRRGGRGGADAEEGVRSSGLGACERLGGCEQEAQWLARKSQVGQELRCMKCLQGPHCFHFEDQRPLDDQVEPIRARKPRTAKRQGQGHFGLDPLTPTPELVQEASPASGLQVSRTELPMDIDRRRDHDRTDAGVPIPTRILLPSRTRLLPPRLLPFPVLSPRPPRLLSAPSASSSPDSPGDSHPRPATHTRS